MMMFDTGANVAFQNKTRPQRERESDQKRQGENENREIRDCGPRQLDKIAFEAEHGDFTLDMGSATQR